MAAKQAHERGGVEKLATSFFTSFICSGEALLTPIKHRVGNSNGTLKPIIWFGGAGTLLGGGGFGWTNRFYKVFPDFDFRFRNKNASWMLTMRITHLLLVVFLREGGVEANDGVKATQSIDMDIWLNDE